MFKQFSITALRSRGGSIGVEAQRAAASALLNNLFQSDECTTADKQNISSVDRRKFLMGMLTAALWRNVGHSAFQYLEQSLLHAFAAHIAGDRRVFVLLGDLVDLVDINDALLGLLNVAISRLQQLE